jgi:Flp pilus assembly protein TadB
LVSLALKTHKTKREKILAEWQFSQISIRGSLQKNFLLLLILLLLLPLLLLALHLLPLLLPLLPILLLLPLLPLTRSGKRRSKLY